jgi:hypothetical protein
VASTYYSNLVKEYPLSSLAAAAKAKLLKFGVPVPQADPTAVARMQREQEIPRDRPSFLRRPLESLKTGPDVSTAARVGNPTLTPQSEELGDTLAPGAGLSVVASGTSGGASAGGNAVGTGASVAVETVTPGPSDPPGPASGGTPSSTSAPTAGGSNDPSPTSTGVSSQSQPAATGSADPSGQTSQKANQGESSSKKKKAKKSQPQPQFQPQPQPQ